jgi:hypothetical protein
MAMKRIHVQLPSSLLARCIKAGEIIVRDLLNPSSLEDAMSAAISSHGAELDPILQANAKAAECAFCLWAGFDPLYSIRWRHADHGYDVVWFNVRIDVKQTCHRNGRLIWPINKTRLLKDQKNFDVFVLACGSCADFDLCGWITKTDFLNSYRISNGADGLTAGTWFLEQRELREMETLPAAIEWMCANDHNVIMRSI